jgi:predicted SAM-dependent methyltransferase
MAKARLKRALASARRPLRLEIGGLEKRAGWIVTNVNAVTSLYLDATSRWPLEDRAIEYLYADNVIEHVPLAGCRAMLAESHRCMRPGGTIRLVTPDIRAHVDMYLSGQMSIDSEIGRHYRKGGQVVEHPIDLIRIPVGAFGHHAGYVYDFETLSGELERAGFMNPVRCELGSSVHPALAGLEARNLEGGAQLVVEATA